MLLLPALQDRLATSPVETVLAGLFLTLISYVVWNEIIRHQARVPGMSGPPGLPLIGNLWSIRSNAAAQYKEWSKRYGDVYQVQLGNVPVIVVNSAKATKHLWVGQGQALSSRPVTHTFHKVASTTAGLTIGTSPWDDSLKRRKKGVAVAVNRPAIAIYVPYLDVESRTFVSDLLTYGDAGKKPIDPLPFIQRLSLSLAVTINWGVRIPTIEDPMFREIVTVEEELNRFRSTTGNLQDYIPLLRLNPLNTASALAREMRDRRDAYLNRFNSDLKAKVEKGTNKPCIQANVITYKEAALNETELTSISLSMLGGGFETVSNTVQWSVGYLAQHPEIQDRAFAAIREFQGLLKAPEKKAEDVSDVDPLPDAADDQKCAYISALAREALRYFTVIPLNLPRESIRDVEYEGVRIPKGKTVYMNAWACNYDPELWEDPKVFRPERWLEKPDAPLFTFGLGYRMCAGHLLATREVYLIFMRLLASFRLEQPPGVNRADVDPASGFKNPRDLIMAPKSYEVLCVPRDEARLKAVLAERETDSEAQA
ncbi:3-hydroxyphenylacetate 6-hydroxylase [Diaporthe helianthi]|uniref:3-hydroxyphenylacetate 6-hydroxylase n=1 Tax=Diaporthe helianthi TaxID=158607 RepID=A0A2P5HLE4_DIAHE|nr:3-hydroxyphenylacetate 6-hydroxylase [Diaporthe helianthi]